MEINYLADTNKVIKHLRKLKKLYTGENKNIDEIINLLQWYKERWGWHKFCEAVPDHTIKRE